MKLQSIDPTTGELIESFDEISDAELETALARAQRLKVGDPMREDIDVGPLATAQILETVQRKVDESVQCSSRCAIWTRRSRSRIPALTAWARASGPTTRRNAGAASTS